MKFAEFDQYSEDLLMAQYDVSNIISHQLMKGEVREDFLITTLSSCSDPPPKLVKGTISDGANDAGQLDIILCRPHAHLRRLGSQCFVEKDDALCVIEVKGNCTGRDLKKAAMQAKKIRNLNGTTAPLYGVVSYSMDLELKTVMNRFGFTYDRANKTYYDGATLPGEIEANWKSITYPELDFFACLHEDDKLLLRKYELTAGKHRYVRTMSPTLIGQIFTLIRSLWVNANHSTHLPVP